MDVEVPRYAQAGRAIERADSNVDPVAPGGLPEEARAAFAAEPALGAPIALRAVDPAEAAIFEEREVERNVWTAEQVETAEVRQQRLAQESHRPELFKQLVKRLSRSGAKSTTLDYESEAGYQAQIVDFARRRERAQ